MELMAHLMGIPHPEGLDQLFLQFIQSWRLTPRRVR